MPLIDGMDDEPLMDMPGMEPWSIPGIEDMLGDGDEESDDEDDEAGEEEVGEAGVVEEVEPEDFDELQPTSVRARTTAVPATATTRRRRVGRMKLDMRTSRVWCSAAVAAWTRGR
jgi:hypothetical protein